MDKFRNRYRIPSARAKWWNYEWAGAYFITICTKNREHHFGEIVNGKMVLSNCGVLADVFWHEIKSRNENVQFGAFVVMPNHIHAILILSSDIPAADNPADMAAEMAAEIPADNPADNPVETLHATSVHHIGAEMGAEMAADNPADNPPINKELMSKISPKAGSVARIIGSYKSAVTKHANRLGLPNGWQARFHDHIIRNDAEYQRINDYIETNPQNWDKDKFHK